jgi:uncharacterized protein
MNAATTDIAAVLKAAKERFPLGRRSAHGVAHWQRVRENGLKLAKQTGADPLVVELFAFLHDCCRESDFSDADHGPRAADFARLLREAEDSALSLEDDAFEVLFEAIHDHTTGRHHRDVTIATCWDADRLDIGRVGRRPQARFLSTKAAKAPAMIAWAWKRSRARGR